MSGDSYTVKASEHKAKPARGRVNGNRDPGNSDILPEMTTATTPAQEFTPQLEIEIAGVRFQNPVWTASGTFGYGKEFAHLIDLNQLGAICVKGISPEPMEGNPPPRIYETDSGMLNAIGLQNVGAKRFLGEKLPFLRTLKARTVVNVFAYSTEDYVRCIEILNEGEGIAAYELNISCPNTRCGGIVYGSDPHLTEEVVAASKKAARYPLFVKLSPNVTDIALFARVAEGAGRGRALAGQHLCGHGHRRRNAHAAHLQRHGGAFRAGNQTCGAAHGLPGGARRENPHHRHRRHCQR